MTTSYIKAEISDDVLAFNFYSYAWSNVKLALILFIGGFSGILYMDL